MAGRTTSSDQNQQALLLVLGRFRPDVAVNAVRPDVHVLLVRETSSVPLVVFLTPSFLEPRDDVGTESVDLSTEQLAQHLIKVVRGDSLEE